MTGFTEQFFDLALGLDDNWRVDEVTANHKKKQPFEYSKGCRLHLIL